MRADQLAREFAEANNRLIRLLEQARPEQWRLLTRDEGEPRPVGVIAHHIAWAHRHINARVRAFAECLTVPPRRPDLFDERNARHAREHPDRDQQETIAWLRRDGEAVASVIVSLSDMQLDRWAREDADAAELTTEDVIRQRQIGHVRGHLVSIASVLGEPPDTL